MGERLRQAANEALKFLQDQGDEKTAEELTVIGGLERALDGGEVVEYELICLTGSIEPGRIDGPYRGYAALLAAARRVWVTYGEADTLLAAWVDDDGRVELSSFSTAELEADDGNEGR